MAIASCQTGRVSLSPKPNNCMQSSCLWWDLVLAEIHPVQWMTLQTSRAGFFQGDVACLQTPLTYLHFQCPIFWSHHL